MQVFQCNLARLDKQLIGSSQRVLHFLGQLLQLFRAFLVHLQVFRALHLLLNEVAPLEVQHCRHVPQVGDQVGIADPHDDIPQLPGLRLESELLYVLVIDGDVGAVVGLGLEWADQGEQDQHGVGTLGRVVTHYQ